MNWKEYFLALFVTNMVVIAFITLVLTFQNDLPLGEANKGGFHLIWLLIPIQIYSTMQENLISIIHLLPMKHTSTLKIGWIIVNPMVKK